MNTDFYPADNSLENWLASFGYSTGQQFLQPGAALWIVVLLVGVAIVTFAVASLSDIPGADSDGAQSASTEGAHVGDACAWACPWHARLDRRRPNSVQRQPAAA